jgi:hypothetical protein
MIKETITIQDVCDLLNELLKKDPFCINSLIFQRVFCNKAIANHPTVQVDQCGNQPRVGLIGIINGLFGIREDGMGALCAEVNNDGELIVFKPTPPPISNGQIS